MKRKIIVTGIILAIFCTAFLSVAVATFLLVDWTDEGSQVYPGGTVLRNAAGDVMRVSLGEGDVDCRSLEEVCCGGDFWC